MMDADGNGYFDSYEFRNALNIIGTSTLPFVFLFRKRRDIAPVLPLISDICW